MPFVLSSPGRAWKRVQFIAQGKEHKANYKPHLMVPLTCGVSKAPSRILWVRRHPGVAGRWRWGLLLFCIIIDSLFS